MIKSDTVKISVLFLAFAFSCLPSPVFSAPNPSSTTSSEVQSTGEELLSLLIKREYGPLNQRLIQLQQQYEGDTNAEEALSNAFYVFNSPDPKLSPLLAEWVEYKPDSYAALTAQGLHDLALAWAWRGHETVNKTPLFRMERMSHYVALAHENLTASLRFTKKPTLSLAALIELEKMDGERHNAEKWLTEAERLDPSNAGARRSYLWALLPRWGGSYEQMTAFAQKVAVGASNEKTKRLAQRFAVEPLGDRARIAWAGGDLAGALQLFENAAARSDPLAFYLSRARILAQLGQYKEAMALFRHVETIDSTDPEAFYHRSQALLRIHHIPQGVSDLRKAADGGDINAWTDLGIALIEGRYGMPVDNEQGMRWVRLAAGYWDVRAVFMLGKTYELGLGVAPNLKLAAQYYQIAIQQDYGPAQNDLGLMYWYGRGVPQDQDQAIRLWRISDAKGIWQARHNLQFFLTPIQRIKLAVSNPWRYYALIKVHEAAGLLIVAFLIGLLVYLRVRRQAVTK